MSVCLRTCRPIGLFTGNVVEVVTTGRVVSVGDRITGSAAGSRHESLTVCSRFN